MKRKTNRRQDEETSYWLSYSDMMAGLLLTFVLIISLTVLRSKIQYDEKQNELAGKEQELIIQSKELENERLTVDEQGAKLNAQELQLSEQQGELLIQQQKLAEQQELLIQQSELLQQLKDLMDDQQAKLDNIIGVRSALVEALKKEFDDSSLSISVDEKTGAITMDSSILFSTNKFNLLDSGEEFLSEFVPRYIKILMSEQYRPYVSEIVIEGHTDTDGSYLFNLDLSQKRAYSVAEFCVDEKNSFLDEESRKALEKILSTNGKSYSDPVYDENGEIDAVASRRVEILFRLRDEEMIREMMDILNESDGIDILEERQATQQTDKKDADKQDTGKDKKDSKKKK